MTLRIVVFGEDVADCQPRRESRTVKGQGRRVQGNRQSATEVRRRRAFSTRRWPRRISSDARSVWPCAALKPVVEIQFFDYIFPAMHQIRNEVAVMRWRSDGDSKCPTGHACSCRRLSEGRRRLSLAIRRRRCSHTRRGCGSFTRRTLSTPTDLLRTAIRCDDPVMFLEHKHLYRQVYNKSAIRAGFPHPVRQGRKVREGTDVTIVTFGALVERSNQAAQTPRAAGNHGRPHRPAHTRPLRLGSDRRIRQENQPRDRRPRRPALLRLRCRDSGPHLRQVSTIAVALRNERATDSRPARMRRPTWLTEVARLASPVVVVGSLSRSTPSASRTTASISPAGRERQAPLGERARLGRRGPRAASP